MLKYYVTQKVFLNPNFKWDIYHRENTEWNTEIWNSHILNWYQQSSSFNSTRGHFSFKLPPFFYVKIFLDSYADFDCFKSSLVLFFNLFCSTLHHDCPFRGLCVVHMDLVVFINLMWLYEIWWDFMSQCTFEDIFEECISFK